VFGDLSKAQTDGVASELVVHGFAAGVGHEQEVLLGGHFDSAIEVQRPRTQLLIPRWLLSIELCMHVCGHTSIDRAQPSITYMFELNIYCYETHE
jgi:hypothetical protein